MAGLEIRDLLVEQSITLYHSDGVHAAARGEQRLFVKPPARQRLEQVVDGQREIRLIVGGRMWVRTHDGKTVEAPPSADRDQSQLMVPLKQSADELLSAWRAVGVRDDVTDTIKVRGRTITLIGARAGDRQSPSVWLDPDDGVVRFIARDSMPKGPALVDRTFSEHRALLGGFRFPYRQEAFVDGRLVLLISVRSAVTNTGLKDELFDPDALRRGR